MFIFFKTAIFLFLLLFRGSIYFRIGSGRSPLFLYPWWWWGWRHKNRSYNWRWIFFLGRNLVNFLCIIALNVVRNHMSVYMTVAKLGWANLGDSRPTHGALCPEIYFISRKSGHMIWHFLNKRICSRLSSIWVEFYDSMFYDSWKFP